jgi:hypothetical protein
MARDICSVFRHGRIVGSGTCLHPAGVGGSQFTMTLCTGLSQTPEIENGCGTHCHFSLFVTTPSTGESWTKPSASNRVRNFFSKLDHKLPHRVGIGPKRAIFRPFFVAGGAKTRSAPQLRSAAGGDVLLTCPGPVAGRRGRHGGARGRKDENPHFRYHSSLNQIVLNGTSHHNYVGDSCRHLGL